MNAEIARQLNHRTIRALTAQPLSQEIIDTLVNVARHTATSQFQQAFSIISITDPELKAAIRKITKQSYVGANGHLFIFVADEYRNATIGQEMGNAHHSLGNTDRTIAAFSDAILAVQNTVNAAESMGLGTVILGSILNDAAQLIELLQLPKLTFPVLGLEVGYPDQEPQLKPRLPENFMHFQNTYQLPEPIVPQLKDYDEIVHNYYDLRETNQRVDTFTNQIYQRLNNVPEKRHELLQTLRQQGFLNEAN